MILPFAKLGTLVLRTLSKPLASRLKQQASHHPRFREIIINFAQVRVLFRELKRWVRLFFCSRMTASSHDNCTGNNVIRTLPLDLRTVRSLSYRIVGCEHIFAKFRVFLENQLGWFTILTSAYNVPSA